MTIDLPVEWDPKPSDLEYLEIKLAGSGLVVSVSRPAPNTVRLEHESEVLLRETARFLDDHGWLTYRGHR